MPYVYSTLTNTTKFQDYKKGAPGAPQVIEREVTIKGGTGVANRNLVTPLGVATKVTDEELEFLKNNDGFLHFLKAGHMSIGTERKVEPEVMAADMELRDQSTPVMPQDYAEDASVKPSENDQPGTHRGNAEVEERTEATIEKFKKAARK